MEIPPESLLLPLPSTFADNDSEIAIQLRDLERELRTGQAHDALKQLRKALAFKLALTRERGIGQAQREGLRTPAVFKRVEDDIRSAAIRYRAAYSALTKLGLGEQSDFQILTPQDISIAQVFSPNRPLGRGYDIQDISWIWRMRGVGAETQDDNWLDEGMRETIFIPLVDSSISSTRSISRRQNYLGPLEGGSRASQNRACPYCRLLRVDGQALGRSCYAEPFARRTCPRVFDEAYVYAFRARCTWQNSVITACKGEWRCTRLEQL